MACPECGAHRGHLLGCSQTDVRFKPVDPEPSLTSPDPDADELTFERRRLWAFPAVFLGAWALVNTSFGAFIGRTCFGMWLHELGHTVAAWLCGQWAVPLPWFTYTFGRSPLVSLVLFGGFGALVWYGRRLEAPWMMVTGGTAAVIAAGCHLMRDWNQELFFAFAGEAGAMLFGAALATTFLLPPAAPALRGGLRWGWLVIGAISWADATHLWILARRDPANLPFGLENGTESDATKLVDRFHWDEDVMVSRYLFIAAVTGGFALAAWAFATWRAHRGPPTPDPERLHSRAGSVSGSRPGARRPPP